MRFATQGLIGALLLMGAVVSAQDRKVTTDTKVKSDNGSVETLTGCVMIGGATNFLLTNITARVADDKKPSSPSISYALMERDGVELRSNQQADPPRSVRRIDGLEKAPTLRPMVHALSSAQRSE